APQNAQGIAGLAIAADDTVYGIATANPGGNAATVRLFKITPAGVFTDLGDLTASGILEPFGLICPSDGNLYGMDISGFLYRMDTSGHVTILHTFTAQEGMLALDKLTQGPDGALYGTTFLGGGPDGVGTLFRMTTTGVFNQLHVFTATDSLGILPL